MPRYDAGPMSSNDLRNDPLFPTAITQPEIDAGFESGSIPNPPGTHADNPFVPMPLRTAAVVRPLDGGLVAVKVLPPHTRRVEYAIFNEESRAAQLTAQSLEALLARFPQS